MHFLKCFSILVLIIAFKRLYILQEEKLFRLREAVPNPTTEAEPEDSTSISAPTEEEVAEEASRQGLTHMQHYEGLRRNTGVNTPHRVTPVTVPSEKPAPSAMAMLSGVPLEPLVIKPDTTTVHVMGSYSEWLTLGLPTDFHVPPPTKLPGNWSQHVWPLCGDIKMSSDGAYNHIQTEHVGVLLQCCFCSWSSGSARMM